MKKFILLLLSFLMLFSCSKPYVYETFGNIAGVVRDGLTNQPLAGVKVSLTPSGASQVTGTDGSFLFDNLDIQEYTLNFTASGYEPYSQKVSVKPGQSTSVQIVMYEALNSISISPGIVDFGKLQTSLMLTLNNPGNEAVRWTASASNSWIVLGKESGVLRGTDYLTVSVSRAGLSAGDYTGQIEFTVDGEPKTVPVWMSVSINEKPLVSIGDYSDLTEQSVRLKGSLLSTGSAEVTSYGFCWSRNSMPTVNDSRTSLGDSKDAKSFEGVATGLSPNTRYYFRAYAQNSVGIAYSTSQLEIITKSVSGPDNPDPDKPDYSEAIVSTNTLGNLTANLTKCVRSGSTVTLSFTLTNTHQYSNMGITLSNVNSFTQKTIISDDLGNQYPVRQVKLSLAGKDLGFGNNIEGTLLPGIPVKCEVTVTYVDADAAYMNYYIWTSIAFPGSVNYTDNLTLRNVKIH